MTMYRCTNFGNCDKADNHEAITGSGVTPRCPNINCGSLLSLDPSLRMGTNKKWFYIGAGISIILLIYFLIIPCLSESCFTSNSVTETHEFNADDFQWPELLTLLESGKTDQILNEEPDWVLLTLLYLKHMNDLFSDPDMNMFLDPRCFNHIYNPEMETKLESVLLSGVIPRIFNDLSSFFNEDISSEDLKTKYPYVAKVLKDITTQLPTGTFARILYVKNLNEIFQKRAEKDARILMTEYQCSKNGLTDRIYKNAYQLVNDYSTQNLNSQ